jgi:DNA invertase Pin-like site-specific DNA recombinase
MNSKIALYVRVSTDKQSHDSQIGELRTYCNRRGWQGPTEYADTISGAKFSRVGLDRLMVDVRRGRLDVIVCYKLDRLPGPKLGAPGADRGRTGQPRRCAGLHVTGD